MAKQLKTKTGETLDSAYVENLVAEAERGFEGAELSWVAKPGRPPLGQSGESRRLQVRVAPELGDSLDQLAASREVTISELVRDALEEYLRNAA